MGITRGVLLVGLAVLVAAGPAAGAPPTAVDIENSEFVPADVTIDNGTGIEWTNFDPDQPVEDDDGQTDRTRLSVQVRLPALRIQDATVTEGNRGTKTLAFAVRLSAAVTYPVTASFGTRERTAHAPGDFTARTGKLTFNPGRTRRTIAIAVRGDRRDEATERFAVVLSKPGGARIVDGTAVGTIRDNDP